ncbi:MAG: RNA polymerase factor sigma-54 [Thermodesulfobacteriota bacterium]|jgi:RNA polymerase sigma-54 factor|nr:MAG: RNA polymerase factor sigma-54 [Thermodesulfobacteriota bacterium]
MALEIKQTLKLTQQLVMTPQLQQAIKLLQLSRIELLDLIRQEMKENPILEEVQDTDAEKTDQETQITEEISTVGDEKPDIGNDAKDADFDWQDYLYHDAKTPWGSSFFDREENDDESISFFERNPNKRGSLQDHLFEQLVFAPLTLEEKKLGQLIIGNLDNNGYLNATLEDLALSSGTTINTMEVILKEVQKFDPPGVAARNLKECLRLQLTNIKEKDKIFIEKILDRHMNTLGAKKYDVIAKDLQVRREDVIRAVKIIYSLDPKPGRAFDTEEPKYITPDLYVYKIGEEFVVVLNDDGLPRLHINAFYRQILGNNNRVAEDSKEYIQNKLRSAVWLIKSIYHRQNTLRNVMYSIIKFQKDFFNKGIDWLKPLILRDVAEDINMHESTVSRATNNKYVHTSHGIFELKFFFNSSINSLDGDNFASKSVKDRIRKIIAIENTISPYSDQEIVEILKGNNINIARRTVTKYRKMMSILPSHIRKKAF